MKPEDFINERELSELNKVKKKIKKKRVKEGEKEKMRDKKCGVTLMQRR